MSRKHTGFTENDDLITQKHISLFHQVLNGIYPSGNVPGYDADIMGYVICTTNNTDVMRTWDTKRDTQATTILRI